MIENGKSKKQIATVTAHRSAHFRSMIVHSAHVHTCLGRTEIYRNSIILNKNFFTPIQSRERMKQKQKTVYDRVEMSKS